MIIISWRITKSKYAASAFDGDGARLSGGRWNSPGVPVIYTAGSVSLAKLEMLVHLQSNDLLKRYVLFDVCFDDSLVESVDPRKLPRTWRRYPPPRSVQCVGDDWVSAARSAVLRVPSVHVPGNSSEFNYLLNSAHPDFPKVRIGSKQPLNFDLRLSKKND